MCNEEESEARKEAQIWRDKFNNLRDEYASFVQFEIEGREIGTKKVRHLVDALQEENGRLRSMASLHKSSFKKEKRQAAKLMGKLTFCEDKHRGAQKEAQIWKEKCARLQVAYAELEKGYSDFLQNDELSTGTIFLLREVALWRHKLKMSARHNAKFVEARKQAESERDSMKERVDSLTWALSKLREEKNG